MLEENTNNAVGSLEEFKALSNTTQLTTSAAEKTLLEPSNQDYLQSANPFSIGYFHKNLNPSLQDIITDEKINYQDKEVISALDGLSFEEQENIIVHANNKNSLLKHAESVKVQKESQKIIEEADDGVSGFLKEMAFGLTTPISILTLPIGGPALKAGSLALSATKVIGAGAVIGGVSLAADYATMQAIGKDEDVLQGLMYGSAFGGAVGAVLSLPAAISLRKTQAALSDIDNGVKFDSNYSYDAESGNVKILNRIEQQTIEREFAPDSPQYKEAYESFVKKNDENIKIYEDEITKIKTETIPEVLNLESNIKLIDEQIVKIKSDIEASKIDIEPEIIKTKTIKERVKKDVEVEIPIEKRVNTALKNLKGTDNVSFKKLKGAFDSFKGSKTGKPSKALLSFIKSVPEKETIQKSFWEPKDITAKVPKSDKQIASEIKKTKETLFNTQASGLLQKKEELNILLKDAKLREKELKKEAIKQIPKPPKEKFTAPKYESIEAVEVEGEKEFYGLMNIPRMTKIFGDEAKANSFIEGITGLPKKAYYAIERTLGSQINTLYESANIYVRNVAYRISAPTHGLYYADGSPVVFKENAMDYKTKTLAGFKRRFDGDLDNIYKKAKRNGDVLNINDFNEKTSKFYNEYVSLHTKNVYDYANSISDDIPFEEKLIMARNTVETEIKGPQYLVDSLNATKKYYEKMLNEGQLIKVKGLENASSKEIYKPIIYDFDKIRKMGKTELFPIIKRAVEEHPANRNLSAQKIDETTNNYVTSLLDAANSSIDSGVATFIKGESLGTNLLARKLKLDQLQIAEITKNELKDVIGSYHYKTSGRLALQKYFNNSDVGEVIEFIKKDAVNNGTPLEQFEIKALDDSLKDLTGILRLSSVANDGFLWSTSRTLQSFNVARLLGNSGVLQLSELAMNTTAMSFQGMFTATGFSKMFSNARKAMYNPNGTVNDELTELLIDMGYMNNTLMNHRANRYGDLDNGLNMTSKIESGMSSLSSTMMKVNGMQSVMSFQETYVAAATIQGIKRLNIEKMSKSSEVLYAGLGLDKNDLSRLQKALKENTDNNLEKINLDNFEPDLEKKLRVAVGRNMDNNIIIGDSIHNPKFLKTTGAYDPITKLIFQFIRFPITAQTVLLKKGIEQNTAGLLAGAMASMLTYGGMQYLIEEAKLASGVINSSDRKYDIMENDDHAKNLFLKSFGYIASLGTFTLTYDYAASLLNLPKPGYDFRFKNQGIVDMFGPTATMFNDMQILLAKYVAGEYISDSDMKRMQILIPFITLPGMREGFNHMIDEF